MDDAVLKAACAFYKLKNGRLPGSNRTSRLRKKRRKIVLKWWHSKPSTFGYSILMPVLDAYLDFQTTKRVQEARFLAMSTTPEAIWRRIENESH